MQLTTRYYLYFALSLFITALIYSFGLHGPFLFDDNVNLPQTVLKDFNLANLSFVISQHSTGFIGRPVAVLSFIANTSIFGDTSFGFKLGNLLFHLLTGINIFFISKILFSKFYTDQRKIMLAALVTSSFWLLHPIQVSTVLYAVQRMAILSAFFCSLGILAYLKARQLLVAGNNKGSWLLLAIIPCLVMAAFSKENGLLLPGYLLVIEVFIYNYRFENSFASSRLGMFHGLVIWLPALIAMFYLASHWQMFVIDHYSYREFDLAQRLLTQTRVLCYYLRLILLPNLTEFGLYHDDLAVSTALGTSELISGLGLIGLASLCLLLFKRAPIIAAGIALFFMAHVMESSIFALELIFEHRNYFALFGIGLIISDLFCCKIKLPERKKLIPASLAIVACAIIGITGLRVHIWSGIDTFYQAHLLHHPQSARANIDYANLLMQQGMWDDGLAILDKVHQTQPNNPGPLVHKLSYYCKNAAELDQATLDELAEKITQSKSIYYFSNALIVLAEHVTRTECESLTANTMIALIKQALSNPAIINHKLVSQQLLHSLGKLYFYKGEPEQAFQYLDDAYLANPKKLKPLYQKAIQQMAIGDFNAAKLSITRLYQANKQTRFNETPKIKSLEQELKHYEQFHKQ